jgi:hypothetical protein
MPTRAVQHQIDDKGENILQRLLPPEWIVNKYQRDYGKDFVVETVDAGKVTGEIFHIQLKSSLGWKITRKRYVSVPLSREHFAYFQTQVAEPMCVVAVDTTKEAGYFCFAHLFPALDPHATNKSVSVQLPAANLLTDSVLLRKCLSQAWAAARDAHPGTPKAAVAKKLESLTRTDPRFDYTISVTPTGEQVHLKAKSPAEVFLRIQGDPKATNRARKNLIERGIPIQAANGLKLMVDGSPLFDQQGNSIARVEWTLTKRVDINVTAKHPDGTDVQLPTYQTISKGGMRECRFELTHPKMPLQMRLKMQFLPRPQSVSVSFNMRWNPRCWVGEPLDRLPWLRQSLRFFEALEHNDCNLRFELSECGNTWGTIACPDAASCRRITAVIPFLRFLSVAQRVAKQLNIGLCYPRRWWKEDHRDIEELDALIRTGRSSFSRKGDFSISFSAANVQTLQVMSPKSPLTLTGEQIRYRVLV